MFSVVPAGATPVDGGQVHLLVAQHLVAHGERGTAGAHGPAVDGVGAGVGLGPEHRRELAHVDHHVVAAGVGVDPVEDVAGVDVDPPDRRGGALERHDPDAGAVGLVPPEREPAAGSSVDGGQGDVEVEDHRQVPEHDVAIGDGEVVDHGRPRDRHLLARHQRPVGLGHVVGEERRGEPVPEEVHAAGVGVDLRVGGHGRLQLPAEVVGTHRGEVGGRQLVREAHLAGGQQLPAVGEHAHVALVAGPAGCAAAQEVGLGGVHRRLHVAVPVPAGLAAVEAHPVHHAVAQEPVGRGVARRVGAVAGVEPGERGRQRARDVEVERLGLLGHRRVVALHPVGLVVGVDHRHQRGAGTGARGGAGGTGPTRIGARAGAEQRTGRPGGGDRRHPLQEGPSFEQRMARQRMLARRWSTMVVP